MAKKYAKDEFVPKNPQKYVGKLPIMYRSSWERAVMVKLDEHPNIVAWASESVSIPYRNPLTGKWSMYIPDFLIVYLDKNGVKHCEMVEVKPQKEVPGLQLLSEKGTPKRVSQRDKLTQAINAAKWQSAMQFCVKRGWKFRVLTEASLFSYKRK